MSVVSFSFPSTGSWVVLLTFLLAMSSASPIDSSPSSDEVPNSLSTAVHRNHGNLSSSETTELISGLVFIVLLTAAVIAWLVIRRRRAKVARDFPPSAAKPASTLGATSSLGGGESEKEGWVQFGSKGAMLSPRGESLPRFDQEEKGVIAEGDLEEVLADDKQAQLGHRVEGWLGDVKEPPAAATRLSIVPHANNYRDSITPSESASMVGARKGKKWFAGKRR